MTYDEFINYEQSYRETLLHIIHVCIFFSRFFGERMTTLSSSKLLYF